MISYTFYHQILDSMSKHEVNFFTCLQGIKDHQQCKCDSVPAVTMVTTPQINSLDGAFNTMLTNTRFVAKLTNLVERLVSILIV